MEGGVGERRDPRTIVARRDPKDRAGVEFPLRIGGDGSRELEDVVHAEGIDPVEDFDLVVTRERDEELHALSMRRNRQSNRLSLCRFGCTCVWVVILPRIRDRSLRRVLPIVHA